jgi:hypothetical protein
LGKRISSCQLLCILLDLKLGDSQGDDDISESVWMDCKARSLCDCCLVRASNTTESTIWPDLGISNNPAIPHVPKSCNGASRLYPHGTLRIPFLAPYGTCRERTWDMVWFKIHTQSKISKKHMNRKRNDLNLVL